MKDKKADPFIIGRKVYESGRVKYDEDFKRSAVDLISSSRQPVATIANQLGVPYKTLEKWKTRYAPQQGLAALKNLPPPTHEQMHQLRQELAMSQQECFILKKALVICSRESHKLGSS
jgi:transposase